MFQGKFVKYLNWFSQISRILAKNAPTLAKMDKSAPKNTVL